MGQTPGEVAVGRTGGVFQKVQGDLPSAAAFCFSFGSALALALGLADFMGMRLTGRVIGLGPVRPVHIPMNAMRSSATVTIHLRHHKVPPSLHQQDP